MGTGDPSAVAICPGMVPPVEPMREMPRMSDPSTVSIMMAASGLSPGPFASCVEALNLYSPGVTFKIERLPSAPPHVIAAAPAAEHAEVVPAHFLPEAHALEGPSLRIEGCARDCRGPAGDEGEGRESADRLSTSCAGSGSVFWMGSPNSSVTRPEMTPIFGIAKSTRSST